MRPRKGVNVAALVRSPEDEPSRPNLRLRVVGVCVLVLFLVLVLLVIGGIMAIASPPDACC